MFDIQRDDGSHVATVEANDLYHAVMQWQCHIPTPVTSLYVIDSGPKYLTISINGETFDVVEA